MEIDVLMAEVERRVAEKKAAGMYAIDALVSPTPSADVQPFAVGDLAELALLVDVIPDFELARSTKRGIGGIVSRLKSRLSRATSQPLIGMGDQQSQFNASLLSYLTELAQEVAVLRAEVAGLKGSKDDDRA